MKSVLEKYANLSKTLILKEIYISFIKIKKPNPYEKIFIHPFYSTFFFIALPG